MTQGETSHAGGSVQYVNNIPDTPATRPFFSQVVWAGDTAYLSGQIALDPTTNQLVEGGLVAETETIFDSLEKTLAGVGLSFADVAKVSVYLIDIEDFQPMNEVYARRIGNARPARETVVVKSLARGARIEITMTAYKGR